MEAFRKQQQKISLRQMPRFCFIVTGKPAVQAETGNIKHEIKHSMQKLRVSNLYLYTQPRHHFSHHQESQIVFKSSDSLSKLVTTSKLENG